MPPADRPRRGRSRPAAGHSRRHAAESRSDALILYGRHPVLAALGNPARPVRRILTLGAPDAELAEATAARGLDAELLERGAFEALVGAEAAHQGIGAVVAALPEPDLRTLMAVEQGLLIVLDQVNDSRNVGAILRSAAAFGATALVMQTRHAAPLNGACAKAASGALEWVPVLHEVNLARLLSKLQGAGWWIAGLDGAGEQTLAEFEPTPKQVVVLGAEGRGLRPLIAERCDRRVRIPIQAPVESLNVAVSAGIVLAHCATATATAQQ